MKVEVSSQLLGRDSFGVAFSSPAKRRGLFLSPRPFELPGQVPHSGQQVPSPVAVCCPVPCTAGCGELRDPLENPDSWFC